LLIKTALPCTHYRICSMKLNSLLPLFFILLCRNIAGAQDSVQLSGTIVHALDTKITISFNDNNLAYYPKVYTAAIDKKGSFSLKFPFPKGVFLVAEIVHGEKLAEVLLRAGDSLKLWVNTQNFDSSIHYTGRGGDIQDFIALHTLTMGRMNQYTLGIRNAINEQPEVFLSKMDAGFKAEGQFLSAHGTKLPAAFKWYWMRYYEFYNYFFMQQYPRMHELVKQKRFNDTIPRGNYLTIKTMPYVFNDSFLQLPPYLLYLTGVLETKLISEGFVWVGRDTVKLRMMEDSVNNLAYATLPDKSGEYFIAQNIYGHAKTQFLAKTEAQFTRFKNRWPGSSYLPLLGKQVSLAERLAPGQPAPDFDVVTPDGKQMKLSDLKGKVVYLGFWAGWCRQCIGEMIAEKKVKELIRNKPLEFVYVSIGNDSAAEQQIAKQYKIDGIFTVAKSGWESKEVGLYGVQGIPAYYLIDEEGNFALQSAPNPTRKVELVLAIEKLFK
jgi:peroxiredoxin